MLPSDPHTDLPLRIGLVCPYSLSRPGGVQGQVVGLARSLEARGHKVTVFAPLDDDSSGPSDIDLVATGHSVSLSSNGSVAPVSLSLRTVLAARATLVAGDFDVVHVHEPFAPGLPYGLLLGSGVPPFVATFHRSGPSFWHRTLIPLTRQLSRRFAIQCAVSEAARDTTAGSVRGTVEITFNGIEVDRYRSVEPWPSDRPSVLFLGRHEERKGLAHLLEASLLLDSSGTGVGPRLWIAGDGPLTDELRRRYPPSADVEWLGVLSEEEKLARLAGADILCAPSLGGESFGMVLLEAMASRTVVVASDIGGYRLAAGGHAVLVPPGDADALAAALAGVLHRRSAVIGTAGPAEADTAGDPASSTVSPRERWLDAAARRADAFTMERLAGWYETRYRSAMVRPPA